MKQNDAFPSNYLKAADIEDGEEMRLTIAKVTIEGLKKNDGTEEKKPVVHFTDTDKQLVLNKTNFERITSVTGQEDTDNWAGKQITLYTEIVDAFGESKPAIRVKAVSAKAVAMEAFWAFATDEKFLSPAEGREIVKQYGGDYAAALISLKGDGDTLPDPNAALAATDKH